MKLENWKAVCQPLDKKGEPVIVTLLAFDHMDVFNRLFSNKDVGQMYFTAREEHFEKHYTNEKKNEYWSRYNPSVIERYSCPKCSDDNTETYVEERKQVCLNCGHVFPLSDDLATDLLK